MQRVRLCYLFVLGAILCIALGSFLGCSPQKRYETLSFFFDGVPVPKGVESASAAPIAYIHKPYAEGKCGSCHTSDQVEMSIAQPTDITDISPRVCLKCHDKVRSGHPIMHGPVAAAECLLCHAPHDSGVAHLLIAPAPRVCVQCHVPENMLSRPGHDGGKADCLSCHFGHGGSAHGMLRAGVSASTRPSTMPSASPGRLSQGGADL